MITKRNASGVGSAAFDVCKRDLCAPVVAGRYRSRFCNVGTQNSNLNPICPSRPGNTCDLVPKVLGVVNEVKTAAGF